MPRGCGISADGGQKILPNWASNCFKTCENDFCWSSRDGWQEAVLTKLQHSEHTIHREKALFLRPGTVLLLIVVLEVRKEATLLQLVHLPRVSKCEGLWYCLSKERWGKSDKSVFCRKWWSQWSSRVILCPSPFVKSLFLYDFLFSPLNNFVFIAFWFFCICIFLRVLVKQNELLEQWNFSLHLHNFLRRHMV